MLFKSLHHDEGGNRAMSEVTMPRLSDTMQEGTIARWLKSPGDKVNKGEILGEIETDKATMDLEAYDTGVLEQILVQEGATVPIGQPIAIIGSGAGREASPKQQEPATVSAVSSEPSEQAAPATSPSASYIQRESVAAGESGDGTRIKASPLAPRIAEEYSVDLRQVQGTGPGGRIVRDDIEDVLEQQRAKPAPAAPQTQPAAAPQEAPALEVPGHVTAPPETELIPFSRVQSLIARRLGSRNRPFRTSMSVLKLI
jgi:pyruvate dehydrogenase E2 component (dihydrolipoamide acetyltransferase)